ncbi:MAG: hypothetical protein WCQ41_01535 [Bacillota bacterium]
MIFSSFIGQESIKTYFENNLSTGHLGHAFLFVGPEGIGKGEFSMLLLKSLLCTAPIAHEACGVCKACYMFDESIGIDFIIVDEEKNSISIDVIRDLQKHIILRPQYSRRKVYLIKKAETMTEEAQNCLLKTLEEPPEYAVIILNAVNPMALRETVRSRVVRLDFKRAFESDDSDETNEISEKLIEIISECKSSNVGYVKLAAFLEAEKERVGLVLDLLEAYFRDLLVANAGGSPDRLINGDKKDIILQGSNGWAQSALLNAIARVEFGRRALAQNANFSNTAQVLALYIQEECNK